MAYTNPKLERAKGPAKDQLFRPAPTHKKVSKEEKRANQKPNMNSDASKMAKGETVTRKM